MFVVFATRYSLVVGNSYINAGNLARALGLFGEAITHYKNAEEVFKVIHLPDSCIIASIRDKIKDVQERREG